MGKRFICLFKVSFIEGRSLVRRMIFDLIISGIMVVSFRMVFVIELEVLVLRKRLDILYILCGIF